MGSLSLVMSALLVLLISSLWKLVVHLVWRPYAITKAFGKQGVRGPAYKFWLGSTKEIMSLASAAREVVMDNHSHDITAGVLPHARKWMERYGDTVLFWFGPQPKILVTDPDMVKQVLANKFGFWPRNDQLQGVYSLLGKGLVLVEGSDWARHRRVLNPAFTMDKLKMLIKEMAECTEQMLERWQDPTSQAENQQKEIEVAKEFHELTADIISHTAFGSSYIEGKEVFLAQEELQKLIMETIFRIQIPGFKYLPTKRNVYRKKLEARVRNKLMGMIQARLDSKDSTYGHDMLGIMIEASQNQDEMSMDEIIDNCKTFFFAGHETTAHLLAWVMFLLSTNQDWQEKLREEVLRECGMQIPNADMLSKLKLVNMVLLETLRLYCPAIFLERKAGKDMMLGNISIPKDTTVTIPITIIHRKKQIWGADANQFNPLRFENGISKAADHPNAWMAFSMGPRICIGQNFAMLEAKTVVAMILQRFSFSISPKYKHRPTQFITLQPQFGVPIVFSPFHV